MRTLLPILCLTLSVVSAADKSWRFKSDQPIYEALTTDDPTLLSSIVYTGRGLRTVGDARLSSDRREETEINAYLFEISFGPAIPKIEFIVNPEVKTLRQAVSLAQIYGFLVGQWPSEFLRSCQSVVIHLGEPEGVSAFAGTQYESRFGRKLKSVLVVHHGHLVKAMQWGTIEETLLHEAAHLALSHQHLSDEWKEAVRADGKYITKYAATNDVEDVAESFVFYYAIRYRPKRLSGRLKHQINEAIPNRIRFFDRLFGFSAPNGER